MIEILVATHGKLATGLLSALEVITGMTDHVEAIELGRETNIKDFEKEFLDIVRRHREDGTLVLTDIIGGSPYNVSAKHLPDGLNFRVLSGVNLAMLIEAATLRDGESLEELSKMIIPSAKASILDFERGNENEDRRDQEDDEEIEGPSNITLARVDHRLFHGQVITKWVKLARASTVIIVDDELYRDEFMIDVVRKAAPPGLQVIVAPVEAIAYAYQNNTLPSGNVMLLFKNICTVKKAYDKGLRLNSLQLGGIPNDGMKKMVFTAVSLGKSDLADLDVIEQVGTDITLQVVPEEAGMKYREARKKIR